MYQIGPTGATGDRGSGWHDRYVNAIHRYSREGNLKGVQHELDSGADVDVQCPFRASPLHYASKAGHAEIVKLLLDCGADIESRDEMGITPLVDASTYGHYDVVRILLDYGCHNTEEAQKGALKHQYFNIIELLQSYEWPIKPALDD
jgi:ankyrin repeat protein